MLAKKTKTVFPLYNEKVHIVAGKAITDFSDLSDRRVAVEEDGTDTYLTAKLLFEVFGIEPKVVVNIGTDEAPMQLKQGKADAMFYVAGAPVKLFAENVKEEDSLELLPVMNKQISGFYPGAGIPAGTYAWQDKPVNTIAVKAVLISSGRLPKKRPRPTQSGPGCDQGYAGLILTRIMPPGLSLSKICPFPAKPAMSP